MDVMVWTRQHISVIEDLEQTGRYVPTRQRILKDIDHHDLVLIAYDWLREQVPADKKPKDADYPIWLSPTEAATMIPSPTHPILELVIDAELITPININKWGAILNFSYIPLDEADERRHRDLIDRYGLSDAKIVMSRFYPLLKQMIIDSWRRLFDPTISLGGDAYYGLIWEIDRDWIRRIIRSKDDQEVACD